MVQDSDLDYNRYEFQSSTPMGDAYVIKISSINEEQFEFFDLTVWEFKDWDEEVVDLDVTSDEDEESYSSERTSDRDFIVTDDDMD